jgi:hypothetical protein
MMEKVNASTDDQVLINALLLLLPHLSGDLPQHLPGSAARMIQDITSLLSQLR